MSTKNILVFGVLVLGAAAAGGQTGATCGGDCKLDQDLVQPPQIWAAGGVLDTTFRVELKDHCVPVWQQQGDTWKCTMQPMSLRTYGFPSGNDFVFGFPGPTLRVRKPSQPGGTLGDRVRIRLDNRMPYASDECDACQGCGGANAPKCCKQPQDQLPNCFHGDNSTNLHLHGTHVSPQSPQDYVLLELRPLRSSGNSSGQEAGHTHSRGTVAYGSFQYDVDPLRWTQPEGTHWYHPHKHGSAALQVGSGMAGALLISGPFDDWLNGYFAAQGGLEEKVLVIQQINPRVNRFVSPPPTAAPYPLINGQAQPRIRMYPGQIQRWRLVSATMQGSAQLELGFGVNVKARQIAMDGIQFAPENYRLQPVFKPNALQEVRLSPGNRADFLVQAPMKEGKYSLTFETFGAFETPEVKAAAKSFERFLVSEAVKAFPEAMAEAAAGEPPLLTVEVVACPTCRPMTLPKAEEWPRLPYFLRDIDPSEVKAERTLLFEKLKPAGSLNDMFYINFKTGEYRQYCPSCVDITAELDSAEQWTIQQTLTSESPLHVFHIHTNPFQVIDRGDGKPLKAPYVWQDSLTLPPNDNAVVLRQRFEEFTGEYVLHCHFLGHEDRGMMLGVQAVCPAATAPAGGPYYGKARADGKPECTPGNLIPAAPQCPTPYSCPQ